MEKRRYRTEKGRIARNVLRKGELYTSKEGKGVNKSNAGVAQAKENLGSNQSYLKDGRRESLEDYVVKKGEDRTTESRRTVASTMAKPYNALEGRRGIFHYVAF